MSHVPNQLDKAVPRFAEFAVPEAIPYHAAGRIEFRPFDK
jgi:hypothetical protein